MLNYSATRTPQYPANLLLEANWNGNNQLAPSQSSQVPLTVTGTVSPTPTMLLSAPTTTPHGGTTTLSITIFNPATSTLNANIAAEITSPNNYILFQIIQLQVNADSHSTGYYHWMVPNQIGKYTITISLPPSTYSGVDIETIQVT